MRLIVFFDLPVKTKSDRRRYSLFRKYLISKGFYMVQYSIYCILLFNRDQAEHLKNSIKKNVPDQGNIRMMLVTEKQYSKMEVIIGGKSKQEDLITINPFIII